MIRLLPPDALRAARLRLVRATAELRRGLGQRHLQPLSPVAAPQRLGDGATAFGSGRAWEHLLEQCALGPRAPGTPGHAGCAQYLAESLSARADAVFLQRWTQRIYRGPGAGTRPVLTNLLARVDGSRGGAPGLLLAAHWDTRPVADQDPDPARRAEAVPGANDGASGVAVLLEAVRALRAARPPRPVLIALFDGEDLGDYYYGSRLFARWLRSPAGAAWRPEGAVVADMVGKRGLRCLQEWHSRRRAPALWARVMGAAEHLGLQDRFAGPPRAVNDDHVSLLRAGVPAVLLIDYDYPEWHTTQDTPERCEPASLAVVGEVLVHLARNWT